MLTVVDFLLSQLTGLFPKWVPVEALQALLPLIYDAFLDGNKRLTPQLRAEWQGRFDDALRGIGIRALESDQ